MTASSASSEGIGPLMPATSRGRPDAGVSRTAPVRIRLLHLVCRVGMSQGIVLRLLTAGLVIHIVSGA
ncbi:hypothetical protein RCCGEPOP_01709 [Rhizobium sp. Pop5]|nr:hypothetical protein RCCGEPOP_01709 [Rhizobium sp. Pop5]